MERTPPTSWFRALAARLGAGYTWPFLGRDLIAGLTVATVAVPQAMAYALIAGIEPVYGLYTAVVMTALASLFGSSKHLINGPTNAISLVVFGVVAGLSDNPQERIQVVAVLGVLVGLIQILIALLRLGDLTRYVSESVVLGFMLGAGVLVALTQVENLLGLHSNVRTEDHLLVRLWQTWTRGGPVNLTALGIGLCTLALIFLLHRLNRRLKIRLPELLLTLMVVSLAVWLFDLAPALGNIRPLTVQGGLPEPRLPPLYRADWLGKVCPGAFAIALLGLMEALSIAKGLAARTRQPFDYNRQCLAEGLANLGGSFFQCMPGSGSLTRSAINYFAGAASRLSGIVAAAAVAATLLLLGDLAKYVPRPALAGVLMWTAGRIVDRSRLLYCLRATRFDAAIALATAFAAIFISIEYSIIIGTLLSFLFFVPRAARLHASELVVSPERAVRERQPDDPECSKLVVFSLEGNLFFGAAPELEEYLTELRRRAEQGVCVIVLRLKRVRNPDMVCLEILERFLKDVHERQVTVLLCGVHADFAQALHNLRFQHWLPPACVFLEDVVVGSSTLRAVRRAYEILGEELCPTCPRRHDRQPDKGEWYYMI
jgi:sulfate permease, SulP family